MEAAVGHHPCLFILSLSYPFPSFSGGPVRGGYLCQVWEECVLERDSFGGGWSKDVTMCVPFEQMDLVG